MVFTVLLLWSKFAYCKICKESRVTSSLYSAVLKAEMKMQQKYGKNIKVKHKRERTRGKGKGGHFARKEGIICINKCERERMREFCRLQGRL